MCHYFNPMLPILTPHKYIVGVCKLPCIALFYFYELLYTSFQFYSSTICVCNVKTINDYYLFIYLFKLQICSFHPRPTKLNFQPYW